jgi:mono/diheme cytochrome c family protein
MSPRGRIAAALLSFASLAWLTACGDQAPGVRGEGAHDEGTAYLSDAAFRRSTLEASLVNPENGYARTRLAHYEKDWAQLPAWNPKVAHIDANGAPIESPRTLDLDSPTLGEEAFFRYPAQRLGSLASAAGTWSDAALGYGGLVQVTYENGATELALTCSSCHAKKDPAGALVVGAPNGALNLGYGAGRMDVTTANGSEPVVISDLRPVRFLTNLHHDGNVKLTGLAALAVRVETGITVSRGSEVRPPREVALGLAKFVWSLGESLPTPTDERSRGAQVFARTCAGCHAQDGTFTGPPVSLAAVGTDPVLGRSAERGTGAYRVPSLRGVSTRGALLHDASVPDVPTLLSGARSLGGHTFARSLDEADRNALADYVGTL